MILSRDRLAELSLILCFLLAAAGGISSGQEGTPSTATAPGSPTTAGSPAAEKSGIPEIGHIEPYRMPARIGWRLANGLDVLLVEDRRLPLVTARLIIRSGSAAIGAEEAGLAEAMAELLTEGTSRRSAREIADAAAGCGGRIAAQAAPDAIVVEASGLSEHADALLDLLADVARRPAFPSHEVGLRTQNMKDELDARRGDVDFLSSVAFFRKLYGSHPYAFTAPTDRSIARIGRKQLVSFHKKLFGPRNASLILVGDIGYEQAAKILRARFGDWHGAAEPAEAPAFTGAHAARSVVLVDRPGSLQSAIFMGNIAVREDHPQYFSLLLANLAIGGTFSARLVQDLRETKGFTYSVWSKLEHRLTSSVFHIRTTVRTEATMETLRQIIGHLERVRDAGITEEELRKGKGFLLGSFAMEMETQEGLANALARQKVHRLADEYFDAYPEKVEEATLESVRKAARTFIRPEEMAIVVVGEAARLRPELERLLGGPVLMADQDGTGAGGP